MQVGHSKLDQVVEMLGHSLERPREPIGVRDVPDHARALEPRRVDLTPAIEDAKFPRTRGRRIDRIGDQVVDEFVDVDNVAVQRLEWFTDIESGPLKTGQERVRFPRTKTFARQPLDHDSHGSG